MKKMDKNLIPFHILREDQFSREFLNALFDDANKFKWIISNFNEFRERRVLGDVKQELAHILHYAQMMALFEEPSTRTENSFKMAMLHMGGRVLLSQNALEFSSLKKGESRYDFGRVCAGYKPDVIVLRSAVDDGVDEFTRGVDYKKGYRAHVINAGAGKARHPTQTLLDLYTIREHFGSIDNLTVAMVGDLRHGRTVHSLTYALAKFYKPKKIILVAPEELQLPIEDIENLQEENVNYIKTTDLELAFKEADVLYVVRPQIERMLGKSADFLKKLDTLTITSALVKKYPGEKPIIMHPLPRTAEIEIGVDKDPRAQYFNQSDNGMIVRMALIKNLIRPNYSLTSLLDKIKKIAHMND